MSRTLPACLLLLLFVSACSITKEPVIVETRSGVVEGYTADGVDRFLGIPYAQPPVEDLRWKPPEPVRSWEGIRKAHLFGPWCPQPDFERLGEGERVSGDGVTVFKGVPPQTASNEDCLSLNIWRPTSRGSYPVMLFLHGNALGSSYPLFDGASFARNGIVFVSINFRMYTMGHFSHPALTAEASADQPLSRYSELDILAALEWLQEHISVFSGDPNDVTLFGQSNGGASVIKLMTNSRAKGLFHKAIVQSGNGWWAPLQLDQHELLGCEIASFAGLAGCDATAAELRQLNWQDLPQTGPYSLDNRMWQTGATELIASGQAIDVPLLIGWNDFDGSTLRHSPEDFVANTPSHVLSQYETDGVDVEDLAHTIYTDKHVGAPARWIAHKLAPGAPTYLFLFSHVPWVFRATSRGAEHGWEFPYAFNNWHAELPPLIGSIFIDKDDRKMTDIMHQCWVSFAKLGVPVCPNAPTWPRYTRAQDQLMELKVDPVVRTGFRARQLDAHEKALPIYTRSKHRTD